MKKTLFAMLLTLACLTGVQGQRFEWAKGYASAQQGSEIKGTVADREGNLYILGTFRNDARWDGEPLLPMTPYGRNHDNANVLIAKISPSGQMLWKKVIHSNAGLNSYAYDIKPVGDTAFACLVQLTPPVQNGGNYLYYLDTLLVDASDYPVPVPYFSLTCYTAYLQFDFEGRVQEQHFLQVSYLDAEGNDLAYPSQLPHIDPTPWYVSDILYYPSFDVDAAGNIYLSRMAINSKYYYLDYLDSMVEYSVEAGTISAVKYWVDYRLAGVNYIDPYHRPQNGTPELLVFSPHFDTLLTSRYLFQHYVNGTPSTYLRLDKYGDLYALGSISVMNIDDTVVVDADRGISFPITMANHNKGYLVKLDSALTPIYCVTLEDSMVNAGITSSNTLFHDISFDYDSNLVFLCASTGRRIDLDISVFVYRNEVLNLKSDLFFMAIHRETGEMYSYGKIDAVRSSDINSDVHNNIVSHKNRVFMQGRIQGGVRLPDQNIRFPSEYDRSLGLLIFDYNGRVVGGMQYNAISPDNKPGAIALVDSILYLSNLLTCSAVFGEVEVPAQGYHACIAKYVDTAFMTPYRADTDTGDVRVVMVEDQGAWTYYPNPFRQRVNIEYQGSEPLRTTATLTDATGRSTEVRLSEQGTGRYRLDFAGVPQPRGSRVLFLTLTTASGRQHTLRLMTAWE